MVFPACVYRLLNKLVAKYWQHRFGHISEDIYLKYSYITAIQTAYDEGYKQGKGIK